MDKVDKVLLNCLRMALPEAALSCLQNFEDENWNELLHRATLFGVGPLLYHRLKPVLSDMPIPPAIQESLRRTYLHSAASNLRLYRHLEQLLIRLWEKGIAVILLKGAHLAECIYDNLALRPMGDVDFLANTADIPQIDKILREQGYEAPPEYGGTALEHLPSYHKKNAIRIDLHFNIVPPPLATRFDPTALFQRAETIRIGHTRPLALGPEDLLIHLSLHACIHHTFDNGILPFLDLDNAIAHHRDRLDWSALVALSKAGRADRCLYLMLSITRQWLGAQIPDGVLAAIAPQERGAEMIAEATGIALGHRASVNSNVARLFGGDGVGKKLRHVFGRLFPPPHTMMAEAPEQRKIRLPWLYATRLRGLLQRHGSTFWQALRRDERITPALALANRQNQLKDWLEAPAR